MGGGPTTQFQFHFFVVRSLCHVLSMCLVFVDCLPFKILFSVAAASREYTRTKYARATLARRRSYFKNVTCDVTTGGKQLFLDSD